MAKVSVLIPLFNAEAYIGQAIESVLAQTFNDFELIIVDNRSTDSSYGIVQKYKDDPRVRIYQNEFNLGMARNWNQAILYARGEYIKFLCADDYFRPELLEDYVSVMESLPEISLISSTTAAFYENKEFDYPVYYKGTIKGDELVADILQKHLNPIGTPSNVMFRSKHLYAGMFNPDFHWLCDIDFWLRLCKEGDVHFFEKSYAVFRIHDKQETNSARESGTALEERNAHFYNLFIRKSPVHGRSDIYFKLLKKHIKAQNTKSAQFWSAYSNIFSLSQIIALNGLIGKSKLKAVAKKALGK